MFRTFRSLFLVALVLSASLVCVRLGLWQFGRYRYRQAAAEALAVSLSRPPLELSGTIAAAGDVAGPVALRGRFDPSHHLLLRGRIESGEPGVGVVTPFLLAGDSAAVLVDRGWLPAEDGVTIALAAIPVDPSTRVVGLLESEAAGAVIPPMRVIEEGSRVAWSAPRVVIDSMRSRLDVPLAPAVLVALGGPGDPALPRRRAPRIEGAPMHLGYAIQWFAMAIGIPFLAWLVARRGRPRGTPNRG